MSCKPRPLPGGGLTLDHAPLYALSPQTTPPCMQGHGGVSAVKPRPLPIGFSHFYLWGGGWRLLSPFLSLLTPFFSHFQPKTPPRVPGGRTAPFWVQNAGIWEQSASP